MSRSIQPRGRLPLAWFIVAAAAISPNVVGQAGSTPESLITRAMGDSDSAALAKAIADLGESPLAAIYDAAGPDVRAFAQHNLTLSNPFFEGRVPGSHGNRVAADYIEYYFTQAKLIPGFGSETTAADGSTVITPNTSFRQPFGVGKEIKVQEAKVAFDLGDGGVLSLKDGPDFTVLGLSGSGDVTAPIVLVGYSIAQGQDGYATYGKDTDLSGKIALILRFEPMKENGRSRWADGGWSPAASMDAKIQAAAEHHAAGIIVVNPPGVEDSRAGQLSRTQDTKPFGSALTVPVVMATTELVDRLVRAGDPTGKRTLLDFRKLADEGSAVIDLPNARATLTTRMSYEKIMTDNVGAILPGKGKLADSYLIIGAHYDHVGYGPVGTDPKNNGKLHPGADDNGSGTSGLLVVADKLSRAYAELPADADARSILFLAFSAEESGLIGSHYYANHPSLKHEQMYLMLNMDMIGRLRDTHADPQGGLEVQGTESAAGFYDWLKPYFDATPGVEIKHGPEVAGNSDHASFYAKQVPVLFFFTGLHRQYHTPQDTGFTINQIGAAKVIDLVYRIAMGASHRTEPLNFTPRKEEKEADPHAGDQAANPPKGVGPVRFGIAPAGDSDSRPGIEVGTVYEDTSASEAGIKVGDRLTKWNGAEIANAQVWTEQLRSRKPGDVVDVTLVRDGKEMTVKVKLKARDEGGK